MNRRVTPVEGKIIFIIIIPGLGIINNIITFLISKIIRLLLRTIYKRDVTSTDHREVRPYFT